MADGVVEIEFSGGVSRLAAGAIAGSALMDIADRSARQLGATVIDGLSDTSVIGGLVIAPAAAAVIATVSTPFGGAWKIEAVHSVGPGAVAADYGNCELRVGGAVLVARLVPGAPIALRRALGAVAVDIRAIGAGTAGVPYVAQITLKQIG